MSRKAARSFAGWCQDNPVHDTGVSEAEFLCGRHVGKQLFQVATDKQRAHGAGFDFAENCARSAHGEIGIAGENRLLGRAAALVAKNIVSIELFEQYKI